MDININIIIINILILIITILLFYYLQIYLKKKEKKEKNNKNKNNKNNKNNNNNNEINEDDNNYDNDTTINNNNHNNNHHHNDKLKHVIIEPYEKKWLLQSRVANVKNSNDLFQIFDEFDILHRLKLPVERLTDDIVQLTEQTFRDLVRDKININDELVKIDDNIACSPELFQNYFLNKIKEAISGHQTDLEKINTLALYICCHLSRTRAGGDSFFAVKDIFDSPQLVIIASHTDTHPPTDLHVTDDGWAYITTTSNFDVYLHDHLHPQDIYDDSDNQLVHPLPLATLSARLEEAIVIGEKKDITSSLPQPILTREESKAHISRNWSDLPLPLYRRMSIVCFDPVNPHIFHGGWTATNNDQNDINDHNNPFWDKETIQTSNDGIICISSSMSGAAQLCLPVSRSNKPILPHQSISGSIESNTFLDETIESISFSSVDKEIHQKNQQQYYQEEQQKKEYEQKQSNNQNKKNKNEYQDLIVFSTGDPNLHSYSSHSAYTTTTATTITTSTSTETTSSLSLNGEESKSVKRSNLIDSE